MQNVKYHPLNYRVSNLHLQGVEENNLDFSHSDIESRNTYAKGSIYFLKRVSKIDYIIPSKLWREIHSAH